MNAKPQPTTNVTIVTNIITTMMLNYVNAMSIPNYIIHRRDTFNRYLHKSIRPKLKQIFYYVESEEFSEISGFIYSIWSYYLGRNKSGTAQYVYICTVEGYHSSIEYDPVHLVVMEIVELQRDIFQFETDIKNKKNMIDSIKNIWLEQINQLHKQIREQMHNYITNMLQSLAIFGTYQEAQQYIRSMTKSNVEFVHFGKKTQQVLLPQPQPQITKEKQQFSMNECDFPSL
jgi:hypothetical protein